MHVSWKLKMAALWNSGLALQTSTSSSRSPAAKSSEGDTVDSLMNLVAASPFWDPCDQFEVFSLFLKKHLKLPTRKPPQKNNLLLEFSCHYPSQNFVTTSYTSLFFAVFSSFGLLLFFSRTSWSLFAKTGYSSCYKLLKDNPTRWNLFRHHPSLIISTLEQSLPSFTCFPGFLIFKSWEDVTVHQELLYVHRICFWYLSSQEIREINVPLIKS